MSRRKIERDISVKGNVIDLKTGNRKEGVSLPIVCERIRFYRKNQDMEQKAFSAKIGTQPNVVNNWENGRSRPDISMLPLICEVLGISLQQLFGLEETMNALAERENRLLTYYRELNGGDKYTVDTMVKTMATVQRARKQQRSKRKVFELPLVDRSLAAGIGDPSEYEGHTSPFYLYDVPWLEKADCVFKVNGDSMEPEYHDGDFVLVERIPEAPELREGEVGAFAVNNELYIKVFEKDGLHSFNTKYPVMRFDEESQVYMIGRVLGIVEKKDQATSEDIQLYQAIKE